MIRYLSVIFLLCATPVLAAQCDNVFTDGISTHGVGSVTFHANAKLIGSPDNLLSALVVSRTSHRGSPTCITANCGVDPNGLADTTTPGPFQRSSGSTNVTVSSRHTLGATGVSHYNRVQVQNSGTLNFSANFDNYYLKQLNVTSGTVNLQGGVTYWIGALTQGANTTFNVVGSGTARLIFNDLNLVFTTGTRMNAQAPARNLLIYTFHDLVISNSVGINAVIYTRGKARLGTNSFVNGAIAGSFVSVDFNSTVNYTPDRIAGIDTGLICEEVAQVDHYRIAHPGSSLTCEAANISISACADADCNSLHDQDSTIALSPASGWFDSNGNALNDVSALTVPANAHLQLRYQGTQPGSVSFAVQGETTSCIGGQPGAQCVMTSTDAGFQFIREPLPDQVAESEFVNISLRAVKTDDSSGSNVCVAALSGQTDVTLGMQNVTSGLSCASPGQCSTPLQAGAVAIPHGGQQSVSLTFDANGLAPLSGFSYADAGRLELTAQAQVAGANILAGRALVDVVPDRLSLAGTNPDKPHVAGADFTVRIAALGSQGNVLPSYQPGDLALRLTRTWPNQAGTVDGTLKLADERILASSLSTSTTYTSLSLPFSQGQYTYNQASYSEYARLRLDVRDNNFLGSLIGSNSSGDSVPVDLGEFRPAYFSVTTLVEPKLTNTCDLTASLSGHQPFTYLGYPAAVTQNPKFEISARNALGEVTQNYQTNRTSRGYDSWGWLSALGPDQFFFTDDTYPRGTVSLYDQAAVAINISDALLGGVVQQGKKLIELTNLQLLYSKAYSLADGPVNPFNNNARLEFLPSFFTDGPFGICYHRHYDGNDACDADTAVQLDKNNSMQVENIGGLRMLWGRLSLSNSFGPENEDLTVPVSTEYFTGTGFNRNSQDHCSQFSWTSADTDLLIHPDDTVTDAIEVQDSSFKLTSGLTLGFEGIGVTNINQQLSGEYLLELNPAPLTEKSWDSYLNFDWNSDGNICSDPACGDPDTPSALIRLGIYRGNDRVIHWREVFN